MELRLADVIKSLSGNAEMTLSLDGSDFLVVHAKGKEMTIEVKDPLKAMEMGLHKFLEGKKSGSGLKQLLKDLGFRIKVKYSIFELEI